MRQYIAFIEKSFVAMCHGIKCLHNKIYKQRRFVKERKIFILHPSTLLPTFVDIRLEEYGKNIFLYKSFMHRF